MKTLVLSVEDLKSLPIEMAEMLEKMIDAKEVNLQDLKTRIAALKSADIHYRSDHNVITSRRSSDNLKFSVWQKTEGEQWGNNRGYNYTIKIGRKYITATGEGFRTNESDWDKPNISISAAKLANIVSLLELAENPETDEDDVDQLTIKAVNQFRGLVENEY